VPAVLNAANEVCVEAFRAGELPFLGIVDTVSTVVEEHLVDRAADHDRVPSTDRADRLTVDDVLGADAWARERAAVLTAPDQAPRIETDHPTRPRP
jgi:1-deoxy-D-xylulose-5-phosphate reductoisomerase